MGFDLGHLMKVRLTSLGNEDDDLNLTMRKEKRGGSTVFENRPKSRIQHCKRSELRLHFKWPKVNQKGQKGQFWREVPDRSQKLMKN